MSSDKEWLNNCASINEKKDGSGLIVKVNKDFSVREGDILLMEKHSDYLDGLVQRGIIKPEERDQKLEKQHFVKYRLTKPPRKDS